jgi:sulfide dehydrogenase cytochrome subunit
LVIFVFTGLGPALAADPFKGCSACHGKDGNSKKPANPSISALSPKYTRMSMAAYRDGSRECGKKKMKCKIAAKWTDDQIADSALHFSGFARVQRDQDFDAGLASRGKAVHEERCAGCHGGGAEGLAEGVTDGGLLHGQWRDYLGFALNQYREGGRQQPDAMRAEVDALSDEDREAVLHYYASDL